jgi:hypothetical protein
VFEDSKVFEGEGEEKLARLLCEDKDKRQKIGDLLTYIGNNRDGLYGSRSLRDKVETKRVLVCSSGAMKKILTQSAAGGSKNMARAGLQKGQIILSN